MEARSSYTVLLVEDSADTRLALEMALQMQGYRTLVATNGREALEQLQAETCDVVLSDFLMPEMDGGQFLTELRAIPASARVPVILMTTMPGDMVNHLDADEFLSKPFSFDSLVCSLERVLTPQLA